MECLCHQDRRGRKDLKEAEEAEEVEEEVGAEDLDVVADLHKDFQECQECQACRLCHFHLVNRTHQPRTPCRISWDRIDLHRTVHRQHWSLAISHINTCLFPKFANTFPNSAKSPISRWKAGQSERYCLSGPTRKLIKLGNRMLPYLDRDTSRSYGTGHDLDKEELANRLWTPVGD